MTDFTPTIEQIAEALGEPFAHLAPYQTHDQPDGPGSPLAPAVWWAVWLWREDLLRQPRRTLAVYRHEDGRPRTLSGPTRADALRAAWAYITSRQELTP